MGKTIRYDEIKEENLDLSQLDDVMMSFAGTREERKMRLEASRNKQKEAEKRLRPRYGDKWFLQYERERGLSFTDSMQRKQINILLYEGLPYRVTDGGSPGEYDLYLERAHELYGMDYDNLICHEPGDARVVQLLLADASRSGRVEELPDCLQDMASSFSERKPKFGRKKSEVVKQ